MHIRPVLLTHVTHILWQWLPHAASSSPLGTILPHSSGSTRCPCHHSPNSGTCSIVGLSPGLTTGTQPLSAAVQPHLRLRIRDSEWVSSPCHFYFTRQYFLSFLPIAQGNPFSRTYRLSSSNTFLWIIMSYHLFPSRLDSRRKKRSRFLDETSSYYWAG